MSNIYKYLPVPSKITSIFFFLQTNTTNRLTAKITAVPRNYRNYCLLDKQPTEYYRLIRLSMPNVLLQSWISSHLRLRPADAQLNAFGWRRSFRAYCVTIQTGFDYISANGGSSIGNKITFNSNSSTAYQYSPHL